MSDQSTETRTDSGTSSDTAPHSIRRARKKAVLRRKTNAWDRIKKSIFQLRKQVMARRKRVAAALILVLMGVVLTEPDMNESGNGSHAETSWWGSGETSDVPSPDDSFFEEYFEQLPEFPDDSAISQTNQPPVVSGIQPPEVPAFEPLVVSTESSPTSSPSVNRSADDESITGGLTSGSEPEQDGIRPVKFRGTIVPLTKH